MIMQDEMHGEYIRELPPIDLIPFIFITQQFLHFGDAQQGTQPVPFVCMTNEETDVDIGGLVSGSAVGDVAYWCPRGRAK